jgi:Domain of unknown function (DUF4124)
MNASNRSFAPSLRSFFVAACLLAVAALAQAQWAWKGNDGRMVFSDQAPPQGVADKDITRRPAGSRAAAAANGLTDPTATNTAANNTGTTATAPKLSSKDPELEKRRKEAQAKEAAAKKADEEKNAAAKKDNCERAKRAKASVDSGARLTTTDAKGEREFISEAKRAEEAKRLQSIIASDCS